MNAGDEAENVSAKVWLHQPSTPWVQTKAHIAQSVEHFLGKEEVTGSNPVMGSKVIRWPECGVASRKTGAGKKYLVKKVNIA